MAGYGGELIALNAEPFNLASPLMAAGQIQQQQLANQRNSALLPFQIQEAQNTVASQGLGLQQSGVNLEASQLALAQKRRQDALEQQTYENTLLANAVSSIDPNDPDASQKWDAAMQKIGGQAKQFVGRYSPALQQRLTGAYSAESPLARLSQLSSGGMVAPPPMMTATGGNAPAGPDVDTLNAQFHDQTPQQIQAAAQRTSAIRQALQTVANSSNPAATWDQQAEALGMPQLKGQYSPLRLQQLWASIVPQDNYLQSRVTQGAAGIPAPIIPPKIMSAGDGRIVAIDPVTGAARTLTQPLQKYSAVAGTLDENGRPYVLDTTTGQLQGAGLTASPSLMSYTDKLIGDESGGVPDAKNPNSTALGTGQFLKATWTQGLKELHPELTQGKTDDEIAQLRTDPALNREMVQYTAQKNADGLTSANLPVNSTTLAMSHKLGLQDAEKVMGAAPTTPLSKILSADVMNANPQLKGQTAGSYAQGLAQKFGLQPVDLSGNGASATNPLGGTDSGVSFLSKLDPATQTLVKALAEGRKAFPTGYAMTKPYWQRILSLVGQYDPTFNESDFNARSKALTDFTSGKSRQNITSYNTVLGHLERTAQSVDNLNNGQFPILNQVSNWIKNNTGDPRVKQLQADKTALFDELGRTFKGAAATVHEIDSWEKAFDNAGSLDQQHAVLKEIAELVGSRIDALSDQYNSAMGVTDHLPPGLSQHAVDALTNIRALGTSHGPATQSGPSPGFVSKGYRFNGGDPSNPASWTKVAQ